MIDESIEKLVNYSVKNGLIEEADRVWAENTLLAALGLDSFTRPESVPESGIEEILSELIAYAVDKGLIGDGITEKDLFDSKLMGLLTPRPSEVIAHFNKLYAESPEKATDFYYALSRASDYIRSYRVAKDLKWKSATEYGELDITVNLSKPEKDPKAIAKPSPPPERPRPAAIPSACSAARPRATRAVWTTRAGPTTVSSR